MVCGVGSGVGSGVRRLLGLSSSVETGSVGAGLTSIGADAELLESSGSI